MKTLFNDSTIIPLLIAKNVTVELGNEVILQNINLSINLGETIVFIGPSGGGKTVLLKALAGLYKPSVGSISFHNLLWSEMSPQVKHDYARLLGVQFQKAALFDDLRTIDNIKYVLKEHTKLNDHDIHLRAIECLKLVNLESAQNLWPHELSGGMRLRLGVARSIALKPEILFMDDPTAGLDPVNSDDMIQLILNLKKQINATLVIVTHDMKHAYQLAGRIFFIASKTILETGSVEQTKHHPDPRVQQFIHGSITGPLTKEVMM